MTVLWLSGHVVLYITSIVEGTQRLRRAVKCSTLDVRLHARCYFSVETGRSYKINVVNERDFLEYLFWSPAQTLR